MSPITIPTNHHNVSHPDSGGGCCNSIDNKDTDDDDCSSVSTASSTTSTTTTPPYEFVCPISLCVMKDPVVSKFGQNYDRQAILRWLKDGHDSCPLTRQPLKPSLLVPNAQLKMNILKWKMDHPEKVLDADPKMVAADSNNNDNNVDDVHANNDESDTYFSMEGFIGTVDIVDNRRNIEGSTRQRNTSTDRGGGQRQGRGGRRTSPPGRERALSDDDLSDMLALYEEVLELTSPTRTSTPTVSERPIIVSSTTMRSIPFTADGDFDDDDDDDDLRDILQLFNEVLELTEGYQ